MSRKPTRPLAVVILISGSGSNLQAIIDTLHGREIDIKAVISNRPGVLGLERAQKVGIETHVVDHKGFTDRRSFDTALAQVIDRYQPGLVVLAGFMRILTPEFVEHYLGRMLNIHPSLLPNFQGLNTHQRAIDAGMKEHGVSVHFVTPELDGGPVVVRAKVPIHADDSAETLATRVLKEEHRIYPEAIGLFAADRLRLQDNVALLDGHPIAQLAAAE